MAPNGDTWTIRDVLAFTTRHFATRGIDSPRLDAELLLAAALGKNRVFLYTHYDQPLTPAERTAYRSFVERRAKREPVAYILGEREFYGLMFTLTRDVLVPRPETEHLVDAVRDSLGTRSLATPTIVDVGTGSGAIAVALAAQVPNAAVVAVDVSTAALAVARANARRHGVQDRIEFLTGDLLAPLPHGSVYDVIVANLPYVPESTRGHLMPEVAEYEPELALFAGADGLDLINRLIQEAPRLLAPDGLLALEIGAGQWPEVQSALSAGGELQDIRAVADLQGHRRVALARKIA